MTWKQIVALIAGACAIAALVGLGPLEGLALLAIATLLLAICIIA